VLKFLLIIILGISSFATAEGFEFKKSGNIEKHTKYCISKSAPKHKAIFMKDELCSFGKVGCEGIETTKTFEVLCDLVKASQCYSEKKWLNRNQYFGLNQQFDIVNVSHSTKFKKGAQTEELCAYYK
jgi:hypothetical protein